MKLVAFNNFSSSSVRPIHFRIGALIDDDNIADLTPSILPLGLTAVELLRCYDLSTDFATPALEAIFSGDLPIVSKNDIKLEAPIPRPGKIICIGLNFRNHAIESGMEIPKSPIIFSKFVTSVAAANEPILIPTGSGQTDYEAELAVGDRPPGEERFCCGRNGSCFRLHEFQ
jgi:hypothetical protein